MAINFKDFKSTKYPNLYKSHSKDKTKGYKYLMWIKIEGKLYKKIIGYSDKDKLTDSKAKTILEDLKRDIEAGHKPTNKISLNVLFDIFAKDFDPEKRWTQDRINIYRRYLRNTTVGKKEISKIREMDILSILTKMKKNGLSPRTQKSVLEVLKPLFKFAIKNKYLKESPINEVTVKVPSQKKPVINATDKLNRVYKAITSYYKENPFYQALFLFGFSGRRSGEILNLKWENIDFENNYYWIEKTKNLQNQKYELPSMLKKPLSEIVDDRVGFVFKSPVTGGVIKDISRQIKHLKRESGIPELSLHYMRNILVSALAEQGVEAITLSGLLGHSDAHTINKYLSINYHKSSQYGNKAVDSIIEAELI